MNYYEARQVSAATDREDAGKWRYTCMNDGQIWAVGYCAQDCPGHDTPEEANEHQTQYLLDHSLNLDRRWANTQHRCVAPTDRRRVDASALLEGGVITGEDAKNGEVVLCGAWTDRFAEINHQTFDLCDEHRTREVVAALFGTVGQVISSW